MLGVAVLTACVAALFLASGVHQTCITKHADDMLIIHENQSRRLFVLTCYSATCTALPESPVADRQRKKLLPDVPLTFDALNIIARRPVLHSVAGSLACIPPEQESVQDRSVKMMLSLMEDRRNPSVSTACIPSNSTSLQGIQSSMVCPAALHAYHLSREGWLGLA